MHNLTEPVGLVVGALIGLIGVFVGTQVKRAQKADELFFKVLDYFRGGSQVRNLGISAIEPYLRRKRHRPLCVSLLAGSAIYLLLESGQSAKEHELYNLDRIMDLLLVNNMAAVSQPSYARLRDAVRKKTERIAGGLEVDPDKLKSWTDALAGMSSAQSTLPQHHRLLAIFVSFGA